MKRRITHQGNDNRGDLNKENKILNISPYFCCGLTNIQTKPHEVKSSQQSQNTKVFLGEETGWSTMVGTEMKCVYFCCCFGQTLSSTTF